jgi:hypothetical protein
MATVIAVAILMVGAMWLVPGDSATTTVAGPPMTVDELTARFQAVLGDEATFEVTGTGQPDEVANGGQWPKGLSIEGTLNVDGVSGGFVLAIWPDRACRCPIRRWTPASWPRWSTPTSGGDYFSARRRSIRGVRSLARRSRRKTAATRWCLSSTIVDGTAERG